MSLAKAQEKRPLPKAAEVHFQCGRGGVPGNDYNPRKDSNGPSQVGRDSGLADSAKCETSKIVPGVCKLLQTIHRSLLGLGATIKRVDMERKEIRMGGFTGAGLPRNERSVPVSASTNDARPNKALYSGS